eukprot:2616172-Pleurochrysis_carterae.AAC.1
MVRMSHHIGACCCKCHFCACKRVSMAHASIGTHAYVWPFTCMLVRRYVSIAVGVHAGSATINHKVAAR